MNFCGKNVLTAKTRGRGGCRRNRHRNDNKVKEIQMGAPSAGAKFRGSNRSKCGAGTTMSSSNINWKTPSNRNKTPNSSTLQTSTHSSATKSNLKIDDESRIIVALAEGRGDATCVVGLAAINITEPNIILCEIPDFQSYIYTITKLNILNPVEILIPITFANSNRLTEIIKSKYPNIKITGLPRAWYNNTTGFQNLTELCAPYWQSTLLTVKTKYYTLTAFNGLINYLLIELNISYGKESLKVDYQVPDGYAIIDVATADKLELVTTTRSKYERYSSLFGVLNHCKTKVGARLLRATILQPPAHLEEINSRLDCLQELMDNPGLLTTIQESLYKLSSIHQLLQVSILTPTTSNASSTINASQRQLNYILTLNGLLQLSIPLKETLAQCQHEYLTMLHRLLNLRVMDDMRQLVGTLVCEDTVKMSGQQGGVGRACADYCAFVIKAGVCTLLDVVRTGYTDSIAAMRKHVKSLSDQHGLNLVLTNTVKKGYHMVLSIQQNQRMAFKKSSLPKEFIQVDRLYGSVTMKTGELMNLADRVEDSLIEIIKISNSILSKTLIEIRQHSDVFYHICDYIAKIDMVQSLAEASSVGQMVRPRFGAYTQVIESIHPLLRYLRPEEPTANDIHISPWYNLNIITGANGSGKSIYIRQVILLQIMAQIGCFVPAKSAKFRVSDRILARVSLNDDMQNNASSFVLELKEIDYFLTVLTDNTLIVIDELGRSTSLEAGTAIALAICKKLQSTKAFTFITTHYTFLPKIQRLYLNVKNWQMETLETNKLIDNKYKSFNFTYTLKPGVVSLKNYAIYFARICWPRRAIELVEKSMAEDELDWEKQLPEVESVHAAIRLKYDCEADLQLLPRKTKEAIAERLKKYRLDYTTFLNQRDHPDEVELSSCNNVTPNEEMSEFLRPVVVLNDATDNSSTLQDKSTRYDLEHQEESVDVFEKSELVENTNFSDCDASASKPHEDSSAFFSRTEKNHMTESNDNNNLSKSITTTNSSLNWGVNGQSSKDSSTVKSKPDESLGGSKFVRQLSDGSNSTRLFLKDKEYLENVERIGRRQANIFSHSKGTTDNTSSLSNWGLPKQTSHSEPPPKRFRCVIKGISRQTSMDDVELASIRSELESCRDELLSAWDEDENDQNVTINERNMQHLEEYVGNNAFQACLLRKPVQAHGNLKDMEVAHEFIAEDLSKQLCKQDLKINSKSPLDNHQGIVNQTISKSRRKLSRTISQHTAFIQLFHNDKENLDDLERSCGSQTSLPFHFSKDKETINSTSLNWELKRTIRNFARQTSGDNIFSNSKGDLNKEMSTLKPASSGILRQNTIDLFELDSIRNELESFREEMLSAWEEDENDQSVVICSQNIQNPEEYHSELDVVPDSHFKQYSEKQQIEAYQGADNVEDCSLYNDGNNEEIQVQNEFISRDLLKQHSPQHRIEQEESISYSPQASVEQNLNDQVKENCNEFEGTDQNIDENQSNIQAIDDDTENGCFESLGAEENAAFILNQSCRFYEDDFDVISNASQMVLPSHTFDFNFNKKNSSVNVQNLEERTVFSQYSEIALNDENLDFVSTKNNEDSLQHQNGVTEEHVLQEEYYRNPDDQMQGLNGQLANNQFNSEYHDFVDGIETLRQKSQISYNSNTSTLDTETANAKFATPNTSKYHSIITSHETTVFTSPPNETSVIEATRTTELFKSPLNIPTVDVSSMSSSICMPQPARSIKKRKARFVAPIKDVVHHEPIAGPSSAHVQNKPKKVAGGKWKMSDVSNVLFNPSRQLSRKEIEDDFLAQDMQLLESGAHIYKNLFLNRPSVRQVQEMVCVVEFDEQRRPIFNADAYSVPKSRRSKQNNKFVAPLKYSNESNLVYKSFCESIKQDSMKSDQNDGGYPFSVNSRPNINLGRHNLGSACATGYLTNVMLNTKRKDSNGNTTADTDEIIKKYL